MENYYIIITSTPLRRIAFGMITHKHVQVSPPIGLFAYDLKVKPGRPNNKPQQDCQLGEIAASN